MTRKYNPAAAALFGTYTAKCSFEKCPGTRVFEQGMSMNLQVGDKVPFDQTDHGGTTCPNCKRATLVVMTAPERKAPDPPRGFSKIIEK